MGDERVSAFDGSVRRIDDDVLRPLRLVPGGAALLVDHTAVVHRHATGRHGVHHRADDGRGHGHGRGDRGGGRNRVIVVVPAVVAAAAVVDVDLDVLVDIDFVVDVDVVDAG